MRYFNKEEMAVLKAFENTFNECVHLGFKHSTKKADNDAIAKIYADAGGNIGYTNWACPRCCFDAWKKVGEWYYESKKHQGGRPKKSEENGKEA